MPDLPPPAPWPAPAPDAARAPDAPPFTRGHLSPGWRWVVAVTWAVVITGLGTLVDLGDYLGKFPWWKDQVVLVLVLPLATVVSAARDWRVTVWLGFAGTALLAALAVGDLIDERPGVAAVEAGLAVAALLVSVAVLGARGDGR